MKLSVTLGANISQFLQAMNDVTGKLQETTKKMEAWGSKMQEIGSKLSLGVSAPLSLAGGSALKMAADMEQAAISFEVLTKSAESGKRVLADLQKFAADTPFEFPELREGAQQLLAYGFQIDHLIPLLRKAGDLASGMSVPITEVTRVLGRLKAGDFGEAFERLRDFGISRPDLEGQGLKFDKSGSYKGSVSDALTAVTRIIDSKFKGMTEKQAQSAKGLFATATDSVGMFATDIGNKLITAFDLKGKLKGFIAGIESLQTSFNELSPRMQKITLALAGVAVATGPVLVGLGTLTSTVLPLTISGLSGLKTALVALASPWGLVAVGVTALVSAFVTLNNIYNPTIKSAAQLANVKQDAMKATAGEIDSIRRLVLVAKDENKSRQERGAAIVQLKSQYPDYFSKLDAENFKTKDLISSYNRLRESIIKTAMARAAQDKVQNLSGRVIDLDAEIEKYDQLYKRQKESANLTRGTNVSLTGVMSGSGSDAIANQTKQILDNLVREKKEVQKAIQALAGIATISPSGKVDDSLNLDGYKGGATDDSEAEKRAKADSKFLVDQIKDWGKLKKIMTDLSTISTGTEYRKKEQEIFNKYQEKELEIRELNVAEEQKQIALADVRNARQAELVKLRHEELKSLKPKSGLVAFGNRGKSDEGFMGAVKNIEAALDDTAKLLESRFKAVIQPVLDKIQQATQKTRDFYESLGIWGDIVAGIFVKAGSSAKNLTEVMKVGIFSLTEMASGVIGGLQQSFQSLLETGKFSFKGIVSALTGVIAKLAAAATAAFILNLALGGTTMASGITFGGGQGFGALLKVFSGMSSGFKTGGIADGPSSGYLALLHGREVITPYNQAEKMLSGGNSGQPQTFVSNLVVDGQVLASVVNRVNKNNSRIG